MRKIDTIHIHCSASNYGDRELIEQWHKAKKFLEIGYHYVICNPYQTYDDFNSGRPNLSRDGLIEYGRRIEKIPASIKGHNTGAVAICMVGDKVFTSKQIESLKIIIKTLKLAYKITSIVGHYELDGNKTCPNINMDYMRKKILELP